MFRATMYATFVCLTVFYPDIGPFGVETLCTWGVQAVTYPNFFLGNGSR